jgi:dTDP-4-amino-4,6-dideoxygalactose transaminase
MKTPFLDLKSSYNELQSELEAAIINSIRSGVYIGGNEVSAFENEFAVYSEVSHCVSVGNGLDALVMSLRALGVGLGDEVIVPAHTFIATWLAVTQCGAIPIAIEPDDKTCNIDVISIERAITSKTKVIMPVHLYGQPADLDPILKLAKTYGLKVVEDAAQAHGARYKDKRIGGHGDIVAWSFYPGKNLGAFGDAGAITTNCEFLADKIRMLRNYGSKKKYISELCGGNSRMDPVQAAVLRVKLKYLDEWNQRRSSIASDYTLRLKSYGYVTPYVEDWAIPAWHLYCIRSDTRDDLQSKLTMAEIESLIHYPIPPHKQQAFADLKYAPGCFPITENISETILSLPIGPAMHPAFVEHVIETLIKLS